MNIEEKLSQKATEAFIMAIELYNKPTIKYRVEGFSFFICNAWELLLKAFLIHAYGYKSIYYQDNPDRTISLENCIKKIFTNDKDPLRLNLEKIIELRNISTHFIVEEYEMVYIPLFQSCVYNFIDKANSLLNIDVTCIIPENFLTLSTHFNYIDEATVKAKYPPEIANKLLSISNELTPVIEDNNNRFAIRIQHEFYITKDKHTESSPIHFAKESDINALIIKDMINPNDYFKFPCKKCCEEIRKRLARNNINLKFNSSHFNLFCKYYKIKDNTELCYVNNMYYQPQYSYSLKAIDFIVSEIKKDPENIIQNLKAKIKSQPQGQRNSNQK